MESRYKKMNRVERESEFEGMELRGQVVDVSSGKNPVLQPYRDLPNIIVNGEKAGDYDTGDTMKVRIEDCKDSYIFAKKVDSEDKQEKKERRKNPDYRVSFRCFGKQFESEAIETEEDAEDFRDLIESKFGKAEVKRYK